LNAQVVRVLYSCFFVVSCFLSSFSC
jgi:hypothetical protein